MAWLRSKGVRFVLNYGRQSGLVDDKRKFFGRMPIEVSGGGAGLVQYLDGAVRKAGVEVFYETRVSSLIYDGMTVQGVRAQQKGQPIKLRAKAVNLASGGFEARLEGVDPEQFLKTVREYNAAVRDDVKFDHTVKDGKSAVGIEPPKSNWAQKLDAPPYDSRSSQPRRCPRHRSSNCAMRCSDWTSSATQPGSRSFWRLPNADRMSTMKTLAALAIAVLPACALAQANYPARPIRMIVPLAAGGAMDTVARALSTKLTESLGRSSIIHLTSELFNRVAGIKTVLKAKHEKRGKLIRETGIRGD